MYRIRLATGEEAVYRTVQELAQAVASGMVSPDAEVYHKAANRWLPINTHPDYRAAMVTGPQTAISPAIQIPDPAKPAAPPAELPKTPSGKSPALAVGPIPAPTKPTPPKAPVNPPRQSTTKSKAMPEDVDKFELLDPQDVPVLPPPSATRQSVAIPVRPSSPHTTKTTAIDVEPPVLPPEAEMIDLTAPEPPIIVDHPPEPLVPEAPRPRFGLDRNRVVLIASIAALVLAVGVTGLILVKAVRPRQAPSDSTTVSSAALTPPDSITRPVDSAPPPAAPTGTKKPAAVPPPAPSPVRTARPGAPAETFPVPSKPVTVPVTPPKRDSTPKVVIAPPPPRPKPSTSSKTPSYFQAYADARSEMDESLAYVSFRRVFAPGRFTSPDSLRATKRMVVAAGNILRVYRGREVMLEQQYRPDDPGGRNSLREPFETSEASRALLSDVDSLFALLVNQEGEVTVTEREIRFRSTRTARAYNEVRRQIAQTLSAWRDSAEASNRVTMPRLIQALGNALPPAAR